jgi:hypothetical protein
MCIKKNVVSKVPVMWFGTIDIDSDDSDSSREFGNMEYW